MENTEPQNGTLTTGVEDPLAGQQISHYSVVRRLGRGGMGLVYLARHRTLEKNVAIKFLSGQLLESPDYVARFLHEARAAASLHHQNIVSVTDAGEEDGAYYLVMEYVEGANLSELMRNGRCFAEEEVVRFGIKIASALAYAHKKGIVHRDIKPENLFLTNEGELKVGDLGLAKRLNTGEASMTLAGSVLGTPFYISPEQILESKDVDGRTDIYSLGASLYHLAAGQVPYKGVSSAQIMSKHLTEPVPWPKNVNPTLSEGFCRALYKMMAKEAGERFQSMEEVGEILHAILRGRDPRIETSRTVIPSGIAADPGAVTLADTASSFVPTQAPQRVLRGPKLPPVSPSVVSPAALPSGPPLAQRPPPPVQTPEPSPAKAPDFSALKVKGTSRQKAMPEVHRKSSMGRWVGAGAAMVVMGAAIFAFRFLHFGKSPSSGETSVSPPKDVGVPSNPLEPVAQPVKIEEKGPVTPMEQIVKEKVKHALNKFSAATPQSSLSGTAKFDLTLDPSGNILELKMMSAVPVSSGLGGASAVSPLAPTIEKVLRAAAPLGDGRSPLSTGGQWQGTILVSAGMVSVALERPLNPSEKNTRDALQKNHAAVLRRIAELETQKNQLTTALESAGGESGAATTTGSLRGDVKGQLSKRFEQRSDSGAPSKFIIKQQLADVDAALQNLHRQQQGLANQLAGYETGVVKEQKARQEFEVEVTPSISSSSPAATNAAVSSAGIRRD